MQLNIYTILKNRLVVILILIYFTKFFSAPALAITTSADYAILIDLSTDKVLFEKNADQKMPPASMSKMMTAYMIFERL